MNMTSNFKSQASGLTIRAKLISGFGMVVFLFLALSAFLIFEIAQTNDHLIELHDHALEPLIDAAEANLALLEMDKFLFEIIIEEDADKRRGFEKRLEEYEKSMLKYLGEIETKGDSEELRLLERFIPFYQEWVEVRERAIVLADQGELIEAQHLIEAEGEGPFEEADVLLTKIVRHNEEAGEKSYVASEENYQEARNLSIMLALLVSAAALGLGYYIAQSIANPLRNIAYSATQIAQGDVDQRIDHRSSDEIGVLAESFRGLIEYVKDLSRVLEAVGDGDMTLDIEAKSDKDALSQSVQRMSANLNSTLSSVAENAVALGNSSQELAAVSQQMSGNAEESSTQANVVSAAAEQVSKNLQTVSTGTEEMMSSIKEIAKNSNEAASVAEKAVKVAETTNQTISKLGDSSVEIGQVIKVITSIAQQTNLLALNATIEAARAGEAGKGFAVVANEVKELAKETAKATEEIGQKIEAIQSDSKESVDAIAQITTVINQISDISNTIAASVEEQTATSTEIGRNVGEAARGSAEIAQNISGVASAAQSTSDGANNTQQATSDLSRMAVELQQIVNQFKLKDARSFGGGAARSSLPGFRQDAGLQNAPTYQTAKTQAEGRRAKHEDEPVHSL